MKFSRNFFVLLTISLTAHILHAQHANQTLIGVWEPAEAEDRVIVRVFENDAGEICGQIIGAYTPGGRYYPAQPGEAVDLISGFTQTAPDTWKNGFIRDPKDGKVYRGRISALPNGQIEVRAWSGIFWKNMNWVKHPEHQQTLAEKH